MVAAVAPFGSLSAERREVLGVVVCRLGVAIYFLPLFFLVSLNIFAFVFFLLFFSGRIWLLNHGVGSSYADALRREGVPGTECDF
jgi:multisubunit Na+/H+ antiporter MnhG subunit